MALTRSFVRDAAMTPLDARLMNMAGLVCNADGTPRAGVLGGANPSIVSALATWHFRVQAAEFATTKGKADGVTMPTNDGVVDVPIAAGAPASNSRFDVLWIRHADTTTGDATALPVFAVTSGAAAASPTEPAAPAGSGWLKLATLRAYSGTTGASGGANVLTNVYPMTASRGGVVPLRTIAERDAWTAPLPVDGQIVQVLADDTTYQYVDSTVGWLHLAGKPIISAISFTGIYSAGTPAPRLLEMGGRVWLEGVVISSVANFSASVGYSVGTIPVAKAPSQNRLFPIYTNGVFGWLVVDTAGVVSITSSVGYTGAMSARLDGASWADKRLA